MALLAGLDLYLTTNETNRNDMDNSERNAETTREAEVIAERRAERAEQAAKSADSQIDAAAVAAEELTATEVELDQARAAAQEARERAKGVMP